MKSEEKSTNKEKQTLIIRKYHQYLKLEKALSPNTVDAYQTDLQKLLHFLEGEGIAILDTTLDDLQHFASGLHDSIGLYKHPRPEQFAICEWWMNIFGIAQYRDTPFLQLSSGEQRLALLARAFVKDPELLILDEPLHGLDTYNRRRVKKIIEAFCGRRDKTMIMVTHYEKELPSTIDHHIFLKKNK